MLLDVAKKYGLKRAIAKITKRMALRFLSPLLTFYYRNLFTPKISFNFRIASENMKRLVLKPEMDENVKEIAERVLENEIPVFGEFFPMDWHMDPFSLSSWPTKYSKSLKIIRFDGSDIRVVWEINRLHFLIPLAIAALKLNGVYREKFLAIVDDWSKKNKYMLGPNWCNAMEAAIRAINLAFSSSIIWDSLNEEEKRRVLELLYLHGKFISENLEWHPRIRSNHYLCDLAGLFLLGLIFRNEWADFAKKELEKEIEYQVTEEGVDYEFSTFYHRLVTEIFLYSLILGERFGIKFSEAYREKLRKMLEFLLWIRKPNGELPVIGDCDSGMLIKIRERKDADYLLNLGALALQVQELWVGNLSSIEKLFLKGGFRKKPKSLVGFREFPPFYVYRRPDLLIVFKCGPLGTLGIGNHAHNDQLSFILNYKGKDFLLDPGSYVYSANPELRMELRSVRSHNTVQVNGKEQNPLSIKKLFLLPQRDKARVIEAKETKNGFLIVGEHEGFGIVHRRTLKLEKNEIEVKDEFFRGDLAKIRIFWQIGDCEIKADNKGISLVKGASVRIEVEPKMLFDVSDQIYSSLYYRCWKGRRIEFFGNFKLPTEIRTKIKLL